MHGNNRTAIYVLSASILLAAIIITFGGDLVNRAADPSDVAGTIGIYRGEKNSGGFETGEEGEVWLHPSWIFELRSRGFEVNVELASEEDGVEAWDIQAIDPRGGVHQARGSTPATALGGLIADLMGALYEARLDLGPGTRQGSWGGSEGYDDRPTPRPYRQVSLEWLLILRENGFDIDVRPRTSDKSAWRERGSRYPYRGPSVTFEARARLANGPEFAAEGGSPERALGNLLAQILGSLN